MSEPIADEGLSALETLLGAVEFYQRGLWQYKVTGRGQKRRVVRNEDGEELLRLTRHHGAPVIGVFLAAVSPFRIRALVERIRQAEAQTQSAASDRSELLAQIEGITAERDHYRKALAEAQAENKRLHEALALLGWRYAECGKDGYRCGLCVTCGGYEAEPPVVVVQVSK